jgi:hypothetical protein
MQYKIVKELELLNRNIDLNWKIYSPEYFNFIKNYFKADILFLLFEEKGDVVGILPLAIYKQGNLSVLGTLPKTNSLIEIFKDFKPNFKEIVGFLKENFSDYDLLNLKIFFLDSDGHQDNFLKKTPIYHVVAKINNNDFLSFFNARTRRKVRRASNTGFEFGLDSSLDIIYKLYLDNMKRHGTPPKEINYFESLKENLGAKLVFLSAFLDGKICGANIFYMNKDYLLLLYNLSYPEFWPKRINDFLYFKTIEYGFEKGVRRFDFGPSVEKDRSHLDFKIGFGGELLRVYEYVWYKNKIYLITIFLREKKRNIVMRFLKLINKFR